MNKLKLKFIQNKPVGQDEEFFFFEAQVIEHRRELGNVAKLSVEKKNI